MNPRQPLLLGVGGVLVLASACTNAPENSLVGNGPAGDAGGQPVTNRIDIPATVRRNLGITFATVEARTVSQTLRVPGRFELPPDARREYRTMLAGRVDLLVRQYDEVDVGTPLYRLDSPPWREWQQKLAEAEAQILEAEKRFDMIGPLLEAHEQHHRSVEALVNILAARARRLQEGVAGGSISANELSQVQADVAEANTKLAEVREKEAELAVMRVETTAKQDAARSRFDLLLDSAATLLELPSEQLMKPDPRNGDNLPLWRTREHVEVNASAPGIVESIALTNGAWASETSLVLTTIQPDRLRFRARGLQSDLSRLRDGLSGRIEPPKGSGPVLDGSMEGTITVGLTADPDQRTIELFLTPMQLSDWARPGVAAHLEIVAEGNGSPELAIPLAATIRDGLQTIVFRRDPAAPDKVIRLEADLGVSDGRWVVMNSGVMEGDEVVLDGVYPLMLATSGTIQKGGHFHADGTWHEGEN